MKRYSEDFIKKIREVRKKERLSFRQLGKMFNVPNSTIGKWCRNLSNKKWETLILANEERRRKLKNSEILVIPKIDSIDRDQAKFLAGILYGCEGSKYPASNNVSFSNSDPNLILAFLKLLKRSFNLDEKKFSIHLQVHTNHNYKKLRKFWANLLNLPETYFIRPTIREPKGKKHRNNYMGTCTLRYRDYRIQLKLLGIFEVFIKKLIANK